ncbi:MAG TPA: CBS domain-containing protein [Stellaceae bacterium]|nr:CBS domain-containing protein [Stellaceae bacterium]
MQASDIMTRDVVSVGPETGLKEVARLLLERGISAVPVVDPAGEVIGMVSEGDLIGRDDAEREARRDWWLALLAEGEALHPEFLASFGDGDRTAREVMSAPVVTVTEAAEAREIARLLAAHHVKRVPVLRGGALVGIVSRADLLRAFAGEKTAPEPPRPAIVGMVEGMISRLDERFVHGAHEGTGAAPAEPGPAVAAPSAADFEHLVAEFEDRKAERRTAARDAVAARRSELVAALTEAHVGSEKWASLLGQARKAAADGAKEFMLLRFPGDLCSDGGQAVNAPSPDWPRTLRGEAAEIYLRWERDLKPRGFRLTARVLDFPGGMPGDIGLFLAWGE